MNQFGGGGGAPPPPHKQLSYEQLLLSYTMTTYKLNAQRNMVLMSILVVQIAILVVGIVFRT